MHFLEILNIIQTQYPEAMAFLDDPQIAQVYIDFINSKDRTIPGNIPMTDAEFQARLRATHYYQTTPDSSRQWDIMQALDPATAQQRLVDTWNVVNDLSEQLGIQFAGFTGVEFVDLAVRNNWDANQIRYHMLESVNKKATGGGEIAYTAAAAKSMAEAYGIPLSDAQALDFGTKVSMGSMDMKSIQGSFLTQAIGLYPALTPILERGMTVREYSEPYFQLAARELGINPNAIDLTNPAWMELVLGNSDKGEQGVNTMGEALKKLRSDPRYGYDTGIPGRTEAARLSTQIMQMFGQLG